MTTNKFIYTYDDVCICDLFSSVIHNTFAITGNHNLINLLQNHKSFISKSEYHNKTFFQLIIRSETFFGCEKLYILRND